MQQQAGQAPMGKSGWATSRSGAIFVTTVLVAGASVMVFPFVWMILGSFKDLEESNRFPPTFLPEVWHPGNYRTAWLTPPSTLGRYFINSTVLSVVGTGLQLLLGVLAAYAFARMRFRDRDLLFMLVLATMMIPGEVTLIPNFVTIRHFPLAGGNDLLGRGGSGLYDSYAAMLLPGLVGAFTIFLLRQAFMQVPNDLWEAAQLDGCPVRLTLHGTAISSARAGNLVDVTTPNQHAVVAAGLARERDSLRALGDEADRLGVQIAVENTDPVGTYLARRAYGIRLDLLTEQIRTVDHPRVGVCLDTGHAFLAATYLETEYLPAIRDIAPLVSHLHISDNLGRVQLDRDADGVESLILGDGDLHLLPGWGRVPLAEIMSIPFAQDPIAIIEMRALFFPHVQEAYDAVSSFTASALTSA